MRTCKSLGSQFAYGVPLLSLTEHDWISGGHCATIMHSLQHIKSMKHLAEGVELKDHAEKRQRGCNNLLIDWCNEEAGIIHKQKV